MHAYVRDGRGKTGFLETGIVESRWKKNKTSLTYISFGGYGLFVPPPDSYFLVNCFVCILLFFVVVVVEAIKVNFFFKALVGWK